MQSPAGELARRLAREAQAVCLHYLPNGRREDNYWLVGDARNTPGRSMFVRLNGPDGGKGAAGKWTEYLAALVMLHLSVGVPSYRRSTASTQHNVSTWRGVA